MAPHPSTRAWKIPWVEEPGGLPSMGSHRVGHDWSDLAAAAAATWSLNRRFYKQDIQMVKKHVKRCATSVITREMQLKSTMRYHLTLVRMAFIKKSTNNKWWRADERPCFWCRLFSFTRPRRPPDFLSGFFAGSFLGCLKLCSACKSLETFPRSLLISDLIPLGYKTFFAWFEFNGLCFTVCVHLKRVCRLEPSVSVS